MWQQCSPALSHTDMQYHTGSVVHAPAHAPEDGGRASSCSSHGSAECPAWAVSSPGTQQHTDGSTVCLMSDVWQVCQSAPVCHCLLWTHRFISCVLFLFVFLNSLSCCFTFGWAIIKILKFNYVDQQHIFFHVEGAGMRCSCWVWFNNIHGKPH